MANGHSTKVLKRWVPVAVITDLAIALLSRSFHWSSGAIYLLVCLTIAATIACAIVHLSSPSGLRSASKLGFARNRDAYFYQAMGKGLPVGGVALFMVAAAVWMGSGSMLSAEGLLVFSTLPLIGIYIAASRRYPLDAVKKLKAGLSLC